MQTKFKSQHTKEILSDNVHYNVNLLFFAYNHQFYDLFHPNTRAQSSSQTIPYFKKVAENDAVPPVILRNDEA